MIARHAHPVARLVPMVVKPRHPGCWKGQLEVGADVDAALPDSIMKAFRGDNP